VEDLIPTMTIAIPVDMKRSTIERGQMYDKIALTLFATFCMLGMFIGFGGALLGLGAVAFSGGILMFLGFCFFISVFVVDLWRR